MLEGKAEEEGEICFCLREAIAGFGRLPVFRGEGRLDKATVRDGGVEPLGRGVHVCAKDAVVCDNALVGQGTQGKHALGESGPGEAIVGHLDIVGWRANRLRGEARVGCAYFFRLQLAVTVGEYRSCGIGGPKGIAAIEEVAGATVPEVTGIKDSVDHRGGIACGDLSEVEAIESKAGEV